jgi:hypothetical protein
MEEDEDAEQTPTAAPKQAAQKLTQPKSKALAPAASNKANAKPRKKTRLSLEMVAEEESDPFVQEKSSKTTTTSVALKDADDGSAKEKPLVPKMKARKSLMNIASFTEEAAPEKKKKRKLKANKDSVGKTLFDDEEAEEAPVKPSLGRGIFAARALGRLPKGGPRGHAMLTEENFTFSPLKKDRRNNASFLK